VLIDDAGGRTYAPTPANGRAAIRCSAVVDYRRKAYSCCEYRKCNSTKPPGKPA
jgi:hypothetical protein